jgi:hypothetical protein
MENSQLKWGKWGNWDETESFLGKEIRNSAGADEVEKGSIRRWLEPKEFDCPLHYDQQVAINSGYKGIIAPCTMVLTYGVEEYWKIEKPFAKLEDPPMVISIPVIDKVPAPCTLSFASDIEIEFYAPLYIGDKIVVESTFENITHKELKVGKGAFFIQKDIFKNQNGKLIAIQKMTIFRFVPPKEKA